MKLKNVKITIEIESIDLCEPAFVEPDKTIVPPQAKPEFCSCGKKSEFCVCKNYSGAAAFSKVQPVVSSEKSTDENEAAIIEEINFILNNVPIAPIKDGNIYIDIKAIIGELTPDYSNNLVCIKTMFPETKIVDCSDLKTIGSKRVDMEDYYKFRESVIKIITHIMVNNMVKEENIWVIDASFEKIIVFPIRKGKENYFFGLWKKYIPQIFIEHYIKQLQRYC